MIHRLPISENLRQHVKSIITLMLKILQKDNEENVLVSLRIIIELHKNFRPSFNSEVILSPEYIYCFPFYTFVFGFSFLFFCLFFLLIFFNQRRTLHPFLYSSLHYNYNILQSVCPFNDMSTIRQVQQFLMLVKKIYADLPNYMNKIFEPIQPLRVKDMQDMNLEQVLTETFAVRTIQVESTNETVGIRERV